MTRSQKIAKYSLYCGIILLLDLMQNINGLFPEILGARCFLLLPASIILAMGEDERTGAMLGLFAGLLWDLTSGVHMGFNCIYIMFMCFLSSALVTYIVRDTFITNMIAVVVTSAVYCLIYWLLFIIIKGIDGAEMTLLTFYIPCLIYTLAVSPILWIIFNPLKKKYQSIEKNSHKIA